MSSRHTSARHRAQTVRTNPLDAVSKAVSANAGTVGRQAAVVAAASGLILSMGLPATAADTTAGVSASTESGSAQAALAVTAAPTATVSYERPEVKTTAAAVVESHVQVQEAGPATQPVAGSKVTAQAATASATTAHVSASGKGAAILSAAYAQLGVMQDCTMLVTNSLAAVGIHFHDWPAGYLSLGRTVSAAEAQPGDLIYYANGGAGMAHIAVYAGNGMAVHGGYNGNQTVVFSANVGSGPVFIRVS
ncbi:MAG: hypothetical protein HOQ04_10950 [Pseudarthrobacter sp.]|nr:hypothetical protein [Pseudarthrobacter sp.]